MITDAIEVTLHNSQALIQIINANVTYCLWQRGGGKTGGGIGPRIMHLSEVMPRSQILLFSDTYERLLDRIVPNIINFWESKLGWVEGEDFVKYKRPPDDWPAPFIKLDKYDKVISTSTGMAVCLVSLHVEGSANAYNAVAAIGDEVKYCDEEKIDAEVLPALRGSEKEFGHLPEYLSVWMFTDKYGPKVKWLLKKKKLMNEKAIENVYVQQMEIFRLKNEMQQFTSTATIDKYNDRIKAHQDKIDKIRKHLVYYSDMKPYENRATLGDFYFKRARRIAKSEYVFNVAFLNYDPDKIEHTFYPTFSSSNKYKVKSGLTDVDGSLPFMGTMDYNWRITPMPVAQYSKLPSGNELTLNIVDYFFQLYPKGIKETVQAFCKKHEKHQYKVFHYVYDHTAIGKSPSGKSFCDIVIEAFRKEGWVVVEHYIGGASDHDIKFENMKPWFLLRNNDAVMMNENTCDQLIKAIEQTPAITTGGVTQKDKRSEKKMDFPPEDSTHGPDAFDTLLWGFYVENIRPGSSTFSMPIKAG